MRDFKCLVVLILATSLIRVGIAQPRKLSIDEAISIAQESSFEFKVAQNRLKSATWRYKNFRTSFLPALYLDGAIPNYTRAINVVTLPNGEDTFVSQNQAYSSLHLGIRQNVRFTGGTVSINSSLNRIDLFGSDRKVLYSSIPFSISYSQENIGYNGMNWLKKMEPLQFEVSNKQFVYDMENVAAETVSLFFETLSANAQYELSVQNLQQADTLYSITKERFKLGSVSQSNLLQLKLNCLNFRKQLTQDSIEYNLAKKQLIKYLRLSENTDLDLSFDEVVPFFKIPYMAALSNAVKHGHQTIDSKLKKLTAEHDVAINNAQNGLKFNVNANFGMSNTASNLLGVFRAVENQQQLSIGFSLPVLDWGNAKTQRQRVEANLAMVESEIEQQQLQLEQNIAIATSKWGLVEEQIKIAKEAKDIAIQNFDLEFDRYLRGTISINDLNVAQTQKDNATNSYLATIREYWSTYYSIRKLTLYDFNENKEISYSVSKF